MRNKVIYVSFVRLTDKTSRDWYLDYLTHQEAVVEYWDIVALVRDEYIEASAKSATYLRTLKSYSELEQLLCLPENRKATYVILVTYAGFTVNVFRLLSKHNCKMLCMVWGAAPGKQRTYWDSLMFSMANPWALTLKVLDRVKAAAYRKFGLVKKFDVVLAAGGRFINDQQFARRVVPFNSPDYEQFKKAECEDSPALKQANYAVFLDVNLPYHADISVLGWPVVDAHEYFKTLNHFFDLLEEKYCLNIIIAAHPRADYRQFNPFNGREIYQARTPQLVKNSNFVITHCSTSQSQAILFGKPIIFVYTNAMLSAYRYTYMAEVYASADYLNASIFNIDDVANSDQISINGPDLSCYGNYKYSFLTSPETENKLNQEIFLHELRNISEDDLHWNP